MLDILRQRNSCWIIGGGLLLALVTTALFYPAIQFSFLNFDDNVYVTANPHVQAGLTSQSLSWAFTHFRGGHWHPLSWLSHMLDVELFGDSPAGPHAVNILFHVLNALLVYRLFERVLRSAPVALMLACVFAVHPLRIESVVWVSERKDVLSLFFLLLAVHCYFFYCKAPSLPRYAGVFLLSTLALFSKPSAVVLPGLLLILDYWPLRRERSFVRLCVEKVPLILLCVCCASLTLLAQDEEGALSSFTTVPFDSRLSIALVAWLTYFGKLIIPTATGIFYPLRPYAPGVASGAAVGLGIITIVCWVQRKRRPYLIAGWCWFLLGSLPIAGFVSVGGQLFADRWTYLPHIGLLLGLGAWCTENFGRWKKYRVTLLGLSIPLAYALITIVELPHWQSSESVFRRTLQVSPDNFMAHTNLGAALADSGRWQEAAEHYEEAYRLNPTYPEAINNLGSLKGRQGKYREAKDLFEKALQIRPNFPQASNNLYLARKLLGEV